MTITVHPATVLRQSQKWWCTSRAWGNLNGYANMGELITGQVASMRFYNGERVHQALGYATPDQVYRTGMGGGALILGKFGGALVESSVALRSTADSSSARAEAKTISAAKPGQRRPAACEVMDAA